MVLSLAVAHLSSSLDVFAAQNVGPWYPPSVLPSQSPLLSSQSPVPSGTRYFGPAEARQ
jgi:hypothetical protein